MNGLLSCSPSPVAVRLCVAATLLLLTHLAYVLIAPALAGAAKMLSWIVAVIASAALTFAIFGTWPSGSSIWRRRDDA